MITISIFPSPCIGFRENCFHALSHLQGSDKIVSISIEDLNKDGPDSLVYVTWKELDMDAQKNFDTWCMQYFNRYAERHMIEED